MSQPDKAKKLTNLQYHVTAEKGTEPPGTGKYLYNRDKGTYNCIVCGSVLFSSQAKYDSTTPGLMGWPSFSEVASSKAVKLITDNSYGMTRTEAVCQKCGAHLGHLFDDERSPTGQHYCINSSALDFASKKTGKEPK
jgi:peptide-methionine (R)-S-oxide reductase